MGWALNNQPLKYTLDSRYFLGPNPLHKLTSYYRLTVQKLWRMKFLENQLPFLIPENPLQLTWQVSSPEKRWDPSTPNHPTFQGLGAFFLRLVSGMGAGWDPPEWVEGGISSKKVPWLVSFFFQGQPTEIHQRLASRCGVLWNPYIVHSQVGVALDTYFWWCFFLKENIWQKSHDQSSLPVAPS